MQPSRRLEEHMAALLPSTLLPLNPQPKLPPTGEGLGAGDNDRVLLLLKGMSRHICALEARASPVAPAVPVPIPAPTFLKPLVLH